MSKPVTILSITRPNATEARAAVVQAAIVADDDGYRPRIITCTGYRHVLMTYRASLTDCGYLLADNPTDLCSSHQCQHNGYPTMGAAEVAGRRHAAQNGYCPGAQTGAEWLDQWAVPEIARMEHRSWIAWQERYAAARAVGADDQTAHAQACAA